MNRATRRSLLAVVLSISAVAIGGSAAIAANGLPTVTLQLPRVEIPKYDTIYNALAKAYNPGGKYVSSAIIGWRSNPVGVIAIHQSTTGHSATIEGLHEGDAYAVVGWSGASDSVLVHVSKARVISLAIYTSFKMAPSGIIGVFDTPLTYVNWHRCVWVEAIDRHGGAVTGKDFTLRSDNANVLSVGDGTTSATTCADTTIDPHLMPVTTGAPAP